MSNCFELFFRGRKSPLCGDESPRCVGIKSPFCGEQMPPFCGDKCPRSVGGNSFFLRDSAPLREIPLVLGLPGKFREQKMGSETHPTLLLFLFSLSCLRSFYPVFTFLCALRGSA